MVTTTNRLESSNWKFVAILFAITKADSIIVAALLTGKYFLDCFGDTRNICKVYIFHDRLINH